MDVLYIDAAGPFGGAGRSLLETIAALKVQGVVPHIVCVKGSMVTAYESLTSSVVVAPGLTTIDNTLYSYYRGARWLVLLRELFYFPSTLMAIFKAKRRFSSIDLIHVNEITAILPGILAKIAFGAPLIVHVRSPQRARADSLVAKFIFKALKKYVNSVVAIDETVRETMPVGLCVEVIHNSFSPRASLASDPRIEEQLAKLSKKSLKVGFVGSLHRYKGILDLATAAGIVKARGLHVDFLIVGDETRGGSGFFGSLLQLFGLQQDVGIELRRLVSELQIQDVFHFMGSTSQIGRIYEAIDVVAFPSHLDAPGRPIFEAAFFEVPCIVCITSPKPDTVRPGQTGFAVPEKNPTAIADAIEYFVLNPDELRQMGMNARGLAHENFEPSKNALRILNLYRSIQRRPS